MVVEIVGEFRYSMLDISMQIFTTWVSIRLLYLSYNRYSLFRIQVETAPSILGFFLEGCRCLISGLACNRETPQLLF